MTATGNASEILRRLNGALDAALMPEVRARDVDEVPATRPPEGVEITLARRFGGERRQNGYTSLTGYRLTVRAVSRHAIDNVRNVLEVCRAELEFKPLVVEGRTSTPLQFETERAPTPDEGWFLGVLNLTYVI